MSEQEFTAAITKLNEDMCTQLAKCTLAIAETQELADKVTESSHKALEALEGIDWGTFHKLQSTKIK